MNVGRLYGTTGLNYAYWEQESGRNGRLRSWASILTVVKDM